MVSDISNITNPSNIAANTNLRTSIFSLLQQEKNSETMKIEDLEQLENLEYNFRDFINVRSAVAQSEYDLRSSSRRFESARSSHLRKQNISPNSFRGSLNLPTKAKGKLEDKNKSPRLPKPRETEREKSGSRFGSSSRLLFSGQNSKRKASPSPTKSKKEKSKSKKKQKQQADLPSPKENKKIEIAKKADKEDKDKQHVYVLQKEPENKSELQQPSTTKKKLFLEDEEKEKKDFPENIKKPRPDIEEINLKEFESLSFKPDDEKGNEEYFTLGGSQPLMTQQKGSRESTSRSKKSPKDLIKQWEEINAFKKKSQAQKSTQENYNDKISGHLEAPIDPLQYESVDREGIQTIEPQQSKKYEINPLLVNSLSYFFKDPKDMKLYFVCSKMLRIFETSDLSSLKPIRNLELPKEIVYSYLLPDNKLAYIEKESNNYVILDLNETKICKILEGLQPKIQNLSIFQGTIFHCS